MCVGGRGYCSAPFVLPLFGFVSCRYGPPAICVGVCLKVLSAVEGSATVAALPRLSMVVYVGDVSLDSWEGLCNAPSPLLVSCFVN